VGSGNQASDGNGQNPDYQIGELDLGAKPKRGPSGELAAEAPRSSGMQPIAQARPAVATVQGHALAGAAQAAAQAAAPAPGQADAVAQAQAAHAAAVAQAQAAAQRHAHAQAQARAITSQGQQLSQAQQAALAAVQAQQAATQANALIAQARAITATGKELSQAQQQAVAAAQQQLVHAEKIMRAAQQAVGSQTNLAPVQRAPSQSGLAPAAGSQVGLEPVKGGLPTAQPENQQTKSRPERGMGQTDPFDDDSQQQGASLELELDVGALRPTGKKGAPAGKAAAAKPGAAPAAAKPAAPAAGAADMSFGGKDLGDGFGEPEEGPALEIEQIERKADRVTAKGTDQKSIDKAEQLKEEQASRELAGFGDAPENLVENVKYAIHVARRLLVLKKERDKATLDSNGLEADYHTALVEMGQALMTMQTDAKAAPLRSRIAAVIDANAKVTTADVTMSKTREANLQAIQNLEREAAELTKSLAPYLEAEQAAERTYKRCDDEVKRAEAHIKRAEIELRAAIDAKTDTTKIEDARAALELRKISLNDLENAMTQAGQVLGLKRKELALQRGTLDKLEEKKKALQEEAKEKEAEVEQHAKEAEGTQAAALRSLALYCIEQKLQELVQDRYEWVKEVEGAYTEAKKVVKRYDRALTLYERPDVIKGWAIMGGLTLFFLVALVFLALR
jgi:hypothetical protein